MPTHPLPDLYARWVGGALPSPLPDEGRATCSDCAMCVKDDGALPSALYVFDPDIKCCVYLPRLPNFLAGRALDAAGGASVKARIDAGLGVTPLGLDRPPAYDLLHRNSVNAIGRSRALRCPHFVEEGGQCGIWRDRDAMCSTWFCQHERGEIGHLLWAAVRDLLVEVEVAVSRWAARAEGIPAETLAALLPRSPHDRSPEARPDGRAIDGLPDPATQQALWGGRDPASFYRACAARADALTWADVLAIGGPEVAIRADVAAERLAAHADTALPERLAVGRFDVAARRPGGVRAATYSSLDAIDLPAALLGLLPQFDGRPVAEVLAELKATWNVEIDPAYLRRLVDWGVLAPSDPV